MQNGLGGREGAGGVEGCSGEMPSRRGLGFAAQPGPVLFPTPLPRPLPAALGLSFPTWSRRFVPRNPVGAAGGSAAGGNTRFFGGFFGVFLLFFFFPENTQGIFLLANWGGASSHELPWGYLCLIPPGSESL